MAEMARYSIFVPDDLDKKIDKARGIAKRSNWICQAIEEKLERAEKKKG